MSTIRRAVTTIGSLHALMRQRLRLNVKTPLLTQEISCTSDPDRPLVVSTLMPIAGWPVAHGTVADEAAMLALHTLDSTTLLAEPTFVAPGDSCLRADDPGWRWHCIARHGTSISDWERRPLGGALEGLATSGHTHSMSGVSGLAAALAGKQAALANASDLARITRSLSGDPLWDGAAWPATSGGGAPSAAALIAAARPLAWYRADAGVEEAAGDTAEDGDGIAYWRDQSGNGYDLSQPTAGSRPTWVASAQNGLPGLAMSKASSWLLAASFPSINFANCTIVLVAKSTAADLYQAPLVVGASGGGDDYQSADKALIWLTYTSSNRVSWQGGTGGNPMFATLVGSAPTPLGVYTIRALNSSALVGVNDTTTGTADGFSSPTASAAGLLVGSIYRSGVIGDFGLIGQLYEIAIFPTALGNATLGAIVGALRAKWGC